jgi:hypothetical protein
VAVGDTVNAGDGVAFLVACATMYEAIAASCSSPQTTELNAGARADTLMKWVNLGLAQGAALCIAAAVIDKKHAKAFIAGGAIAGGIMYASYAHAKASGLASSEPGTETWSAPQAQAA